MSAYMKRKRANKNRILHYVPTVIHPLYSFRNRLPFLLFFVYSGVDKSSLYGNRGATNGTLAYKVSLIPSSLQLSWGSLNPKEDIWINEQICEEKDKLKHFFPPEFENKKTGFRYSIIKRPIKNHKREFQQKLCRFLKYVP